MVEKKLPSLNKNISRRDFIKATSLLSFGIIFKPTDVFACPLCRLFAPVVEVIISWAERGSLLEALGEGVVTGVAERAVARSFFSNVAKDRILLAMRTAGRTSNAQSISNILDRYAENNPHLVESYNKYENDIQAWWVVNNANEILLDIRNPTNSFIEATISFSLVNKETGTIEKTRDIDISAKPNAFYKGFYVSFEDIGIAGVKDIVVKINRSDIDPIVKTVFVV